MKLLVDVNGDSSWEVSERFKGKQVSIQKFMPNPIRVVMDKKVCCINPDLASINLSNSMCTRPEVSCANSIAKLKDLHSKIGWFLISTFININFFVYETSDIIQLDTIVRRNTVLGVVETMEYSKQLEDFNIDMEYSILDTFTYTRERDLDKFGTNLIVRDSRNFPYSVKDWFTLYYMDSPIASVPRLRK